jgi:hypothetical protein
MLVLDEDKKEIFVSRHRVEGKCDDQFSCVGFFLLKRRSVNVGNTGI